MYMTNMNQKVEHVNTISEAVEDRQTVVYECTECNACEKQMVVTGRARMVADLHCMQCDDRYTHRVTRVIF